MSFSPKIPNNQQTPAPVIAKVEPAAFQTPGDSKSARGSASTGRSALRIDLAPGLTVPGRGTGLQVPG